MGHSRRPTSRVPQSGNSVSYVRTGAGRGAPGPGGPFPLRAARPQTAGCSPRCAGPGRSVPGANRAGLVGAGDRGLHTPQRPARGSLTWDSPHRLPPPPRQARDSLRRASSAGPELPVLRSCRRCPSPHS